MFTGIVESIGTVVDLKNDTQTLTNIDKQNCFKGFGLCVRDLSKFAQNQNFGIFISRD